MLPSRSVLPVLAALAFAAAAAACSSAPPPAKLPTDLPPPEYEPGRQIDLAPKAAVPMGNPVGVPQTPPAAPPAPSLPAPPTPTPAPAAPPKG